MSTAYLQPSSEKLVEVWQLPLEGDISNWAQLFGPIPSVA